uniref:Uncharacterized protein n=1 Tax=Micrurus lemniscatus lemniscatus TaxID=129467 RepID=A0A2D4I451_MICLE
MEIRLQVIPGEIPFRLVDVQIGLETKEDVREGTEVLPRFAVLKDFQGANHHGNEREVENHEGDEEGEEGDGQIAEDEEEDQGVDLVGRDDGGQPVHASFGGHLNQVLFDFHDGMEGILDDLLSEGKLLRALSCQLIIIVILRDHA